MMPTRGCGVREGCNLSIDQHNDATKKKGSALFRCTDLGRTADARRLSLADYNVISTVLVRY